MKKVIALGELLIDFVPKQKGVSLTLVDEFIKNPGGAPANVVCTVAKLGGDSLFIGQVGDDGFGHFLRNTLEEYNVNTDYILFTKDAPTSLAYVTLQENGEREFIFYRNPGADQLYDGSNLKQEIFANSIFHFCSVSLDDYPVKDAHIKAIKLAKKENAIISFDPNIRLSLWHDLDKYRMRINEFIKYADILKVSDDEISFITGESDYKSGVKKLLSTEVKILIITKGAKGVTLYTKDEEYNVTGFNINSVDTTGAGDSFIGAFLYCLANDESILNNNRQTIIHSLKFANAVAALTTTEYGAMHAIPSIEKVNALLSKNKKSHP